MAHGQTRIWRIVTDKIYYFYKNLRKSAKSAFVRVPFSFFDIAIKKSLNLLFLVSFRVFRGQIPFLFSFFRTFRSFRRQISFISPLSSDTARRIFLPRFPTNYRPSFRSIGFCATRLCRNMQTTLRRFSLKTCRRGIREI